MCSSLGRLLEFWASFSLSSVEIESECDLALGDQMGADERSASRAKISSTEGAPPRRSGCQGEA